MVRRGTPSWNYFLGDWNYINIWLELYFRMDNRLRKTYRTILMFAKLLYFEWSPPWHLCNLHSILRLKYANTHRSKASSTFCLLYGVFGETATSMVHLISAWQRDETLVNHAKSCQHFPGFNKQSKLSALVPCSSSITRRSPQQHQKQPSQTPLGGPNLRLPTQSCLFGIVACCLG